MMGVPLDSETNVFCDNESVFNNSTLPESKLKKKHNSIAYNHTCEAQAVNIICNAWEKRKMNLVDLLTKLLRCDQLHFLEQHKDAPSLCPKWNPIKNSTALPASDI